MKIGCVIMAAGNARRFGGNKLCAEISGKSVIRCVLEAVPDDVFDRTVVVTQYDEIATLAESFGYKVIWNRRPELGASLTIRLGTQAMEDMDGTMYMVADQPMLTGSCVRDVVELWLNDTSKIAAASHNGKRGNPCVFPRKFFSELEALSGDTGGSEVIKRHIGDLVMAEVGELALTDIDTREALAELKNDLGQQNK